MSENEDTAGRIFLFNWAMQNCRLSAIEKTDKHAEFTTGMSLNDLKQIHGDPTKEDDIAATWYADSIMHVNPRFFALVEAW